MDQPTQELHLGIATYAVGTNRRSRASATPWKGPQTPHPRIHPAQTKWKPDWRWKPAALHRQQPIDGRPHRLAPSRQGDRPSSTAQTLRMSPRRSFASRRACERARRKAIAGHPMPSGRRGDRRGCAEREEFACRARFSSINGAGLAGRRRREEMLGTEGESGAPSDDLRDRRGADAWIPITF
jgi:hypothetical protein